MCQTLQITKKISKIFLFFALLLSTNSIFAQCNGTVNNGGSISASTTTLFAGTTVDFYNNSSPSGDCSWCTIEYMWVVYENGNPTYVSPASSTLSYTFNNAGNAEVYRCARYTGCSGWTGETSHIYLTVNANSCSNVTSAGAIGYDENQCLSGYTPTNIYNVTSPSGGSGTLEYIWLKSNDGGNTNTVISGATSDWYQPPYITQNTWYRRCARRAGCSNYDGESNWVLKAVNVCCGTCTGTNLVSNPGFESGITGWSYTGGGLYQGTGAVACGSYSGDFNIWNTSSNDVSQEIFPASYTAGSTLNVSVKAGTHDNSFYHQVYVNFFDANWGWIGNSAVEVNKVLANSPVGPQLYSWTATLPAGVGHITVGFNGTGNWIKTDDWCVTHTPAVCNSTITGLQFKDPTGANSSVVSIANGGSYNISNLPSPFNVEALVSGNAESVRFTLSGSATGTNIENAYTWDYVGSGSSWPHGVGTYTMLVEAFSLDNAAGTLCATQTYNFTLTTCDNVTSGGTIGSDETVCGTSFNPANITNITLPAGGTGTLEYVWLQSTDGGSTYTTISGATGASYDPGVITQTTWYRRCARRSGCSGYVGESNWVMKKVATPITVNAGPDVTLNCTTTSAQIGQNAVAGETYSWSPVTNLSSASISKPTANPSVTTTYTITATSADGCTATDVVVVYVNNTFPTANAGPDRDLNCTTTSASIGTAAVSGNSYLWNPSAGLSSATAAQPTASPTATTTYTVTVTAANGCTAQDIVVVYVNTTVPTANAGTDKTINCTTTSVLIGSSSTSGNTYSWSPATGLSATNIAQPTANPTSTTTYTLTVTGSNGCSASDAVVVNVNKTLPTANAGPDVTLNCSTTSSTIGTTAISGNTYSWSPATGLSSTTIAQPIASPTSNTTYTVTVTGANGCTSTDAIVVTVNSTLPTADAGIDRNLNCTTTSTILGTTSVSGNLYSWSPSTGLNSTIIAQPTATPTATTTYTVTVTGANGCIATDVVVVNVNRTTPSADAGVDKTLNCTTTSTMIGTTSISGNTYSWSPATGLSSTTIAQPTATPTITTTYTVTVTGSNGCTATDAVVVTVNSGLPTANAGVDKSLNCTTTSTTLGSTSISGNTYSWSPATGLSSTTIAQPTANPTATTTYTVTVTNSNGCTASDVVVVNVNQTPPTANAGNDQVVNCSINSVVIGTAAVSGNTYSWNPFSTLSSNNIAQPTANPNTTTSYTVVVTGANGCTSSDVVVVTVDVTMPTANAGVDKNLNCTTTSTTIGSASVSGNTYSWSPATGLNATNIAQPTANPSTTTTYTVTVTGANGCSATDAVVVNVNTTIPTANAGVDKNLNCTTTSTTIGSASVSGNTYSWSPATGLSSTSIAQPTANPTTTTTYTVTVTGSNGCTSTDAVVVNVNTTLPTVNAGVDKTLNCTTTSTTIGTTAISGNAYSWSPATGLSSTTVAQPTANPSISTTYTITVTGSNGCTATDMVTVNVDNSVPTANAGPDKTVCSSTSAMIGTSAIAGNTYSWAPATGLSATNIAQPTAAPSTTLNYTVTVTSANGCSSTDVVTVNFKEGSVGNYVWMDVNGDGINNEAASNGINGITVELWKTSDLIQGNADDQLVSSTVTATSASNPGYYNFKICNDGDYYVKFPATTGGVDQLTTQTTTAATDNNSDANTSTGTSLIFNINTSGTGVAKDNATIDAGYVPLLSLGNLVWDDVNHNGIKDASEVGIGNATVKVYLDANSDGTPDGAALQTVSSNSNGLYVFNGLTPGNYIVGVTPPAPASGNAFISSAVNELNPNSNVDNNDNGITTVSGETRSGTITLSAGAEPTGETPNNGTAPDANSNLTVDFAFYQPVNISGNVFVDNNGATNVDGTGIGSPSGTQVYANLIGSNGNVVATVPVNSNGTYQFNDVMPNTTYTMVLSTTQGTVGNPAPSAILPTGWSNVSEDCCDNTGNDGTTNGITSVTVGTIDVPNVNFGITQPLSLGNLVWDDVNHNGIKDATELGIGNATVKVYLDANSDGTPDGAALQTVTTNSNGLYVFNGLTPGNYIVGVTPPTPASGAPYTSSVMGEELNPNNNVDNNDNGITTVSGETRSGTITLSAGAEPTGETPNNGTAPDVNSNLTVDFAFYQTINLTGNVFVDNNGPTNVDGTGIGSPSGTQLYANLVDANGNVVGSVPVSSNGTYQFNDILPNTTYTMVLSTTQGTVGNPAPVTSLPNGWTNVSEDCCDNAGNDGNTNGITSVTVGTSNVTNVNFGIRQNLSLGNLVWNDLDHDGIKDANESGIAGATVKLYVDANNDGTPDGASTNTTTTDQNGLYIFNNLGEGNYIVGVTPPSPASGNAFVSSGINETNPNSNVDNNDNGITTVSGETRSGTVTLSAGAEPTGETPNNGTAPDANSNLTVDFAFYQPVNISGNVFNDINGPSNVDGTGIGSPSGTQVYANLVDANGNVVATVPVNTNGTYQFNDVMPNTTYTMVLSTTQGTIGSPAPTAVLPTGWRNVSEDCCDNTGNDGNTNGITTVTVGTTDVPNVNFGIRQPLSLGNFVWKDVNRNGVQDNGEVGIREAVMNLYADANNDGNADGAPIASTLTDVTGAYIFNDLNPGFYIVGATPPAPSSGSYTSSFNGQEMNPNADVDLNDNGVVNVGGETRSHTVALGIGTEPLGETPNNAASGIPDANTNLTVDFGFFLCPANFTFTPQYVCPNSTLDLATLEPANYTGGVWSQNGNPLASKLVNTGTYVYTFTDGDCIATGSVTVGTSVPDYTPTITITPSAITGIDTVRVILKIEEILNRSSCSPIYVLIPRLAPRYSFSYEPTATSILGAPVSNADWQYFDTNPNFYIWKYVGATTFPAGGTSRFGYYGMYNPNDTDGETTFSVQIFQGSGGETNQTNNTDSEVLIYFR